MDQTREERSYGARIQRVRGDGFITEPADPRRRVLARLEATVYCHGAINVPADEDRDPYFDYNNAVVLSLHVGDSGSAATSPRAGARARMYSVHALIEPTEASPRAAS